MSVKDKVLRLGCKICALDPALFYLHKGGKLSGIIFCHADDFLHADDEYLEHIMVNMRKRFMAGKVEKGNFNYIGFKVAQKKGTTALVSPTM